MGNRWLKRDSSLGFAKQTGYDTVNSTDGDFRWLAAAEDVSLDLAREVQRTQLLEGRTGATSAPQIGGKHGGKIKFKCVLRGMEPGYTQAATFDTLAHGSAHIPAEFDLLHAAMGWDGVAYVYKAHAANGLASSTTSTATGDTGVTFTRGMFLASATSGTSNVASGWVKSHTGASPDVATLYEAHAGSPSASDDLINAVVAYLQPSQPEPLTIRYVGSDSAFGYVLVGCMCDSVTLTAQARQPIVCEFSYTFTQHSRSAIGGLHIPAARVALPPAIGRQGGRLTMGGAVNSVLADLKIDLANTYSYIDNPNGQEGVTAAILTTRVVKVSATVPIDSTDTLTGGNDPYEAALVAATPTSVCLTLGTVPGAICSIFLPALRYTAQPKLNEKGGFLAMSLEMEAAPVTDDADPVGLDGIVVCPAGSPLRIAIA